MCQIRTTEKSLRITIFLCKALSTLLIVQRVLRKYRKTKEKIECDILLQHSLRGYKYLKERNEQTNFLPPQLPIGSRLKNTRPYKTKANQPHGSTSPEWWPPAGKHGANLDRSLELFANKESV